MEKAIEYAEKNMDLLRSCAESLKDLILERIPEEEQVSYVAYKVEQGSGNRQRLYDFLENKEEHIQNDYCQSIFNDGVVDFITVHYHHGGWSIEYSCGGYGLGPETGYYEIQCISSDQAVYLWGYDADMIYEKNGTGYMGTKADSDNTFFYYRITEGIYYTEAKY